jgi:hypothetical protein
MAGEFLLLWLVFSLCEAHPLFFPRFSSQTSQMFLGECLCLVPVYLNYLYNRIIRRAREMKLKKSGVGLYAPIGTESPRNSTEAPRGAEGADGTNGEQQTLLPARLRRSMSENRGRMDAVEEEGEEMTTATAIVFFAPALCDICGTTLVSSMLRV